MLLLGSVSQPYSLHAASAHGSHHDEVRSYKPGRVMDVLPRLPEFDMEGKTEGSTEFATSLVDWERWNGRDKARRFDRLLRTPVSAAVDFSELSRRVLLDAHWTALAAATPLHVVHILEPQTLDAPLLEAACKREGIKSRCSVAGITATRYLNPGAARET